MAAADRLTGEMVGRGGLQHTDAIDPAAVEVAQSSAVEVAWAIVPEKWGQGLATELAHSAVEVALNGLGLPELFAFTLSDNLASRGVMGKAGFAYEREIGHAGLPHVLYRREPNID